MSKEVLVEGRTQCEVCQTDKQFMFHIDRGDWNDEELAAETLSAVARQYREVSHKGHQGHIIKLVKTIQVRETPSDQA